MIKLFGLLAPVIVPLIVSGILVFSSEKSNRPKLYLAGYMLGIAFIFAANALYFEHNYEMYAWVHSVHIGAVLAIYPGAYIYIILLIDPNRSKKKLIKHFFPSMVFFLASALIFFPLLNPDERSLFLAEYRFNPDFSMKWLKILYFIRMGNIAVLFIQVFIYVFLIYSALTKHRKVVAGIFSNPERFQLNWVSFFNIALALSAFIAVFLYAVNPSKLFGDDRYLSYPMLVVALILWFLGIMGNNQPLLPESLHSNPGDDLGNDIKPLDDLSAKLSNYFSNKRPYLNPELKIWDVALELGSNRTYISRAINISFGQNFSSFVNSFRVKEAEILIRKDPFKPLKIIAEEVGFGSVSSLTRSFSEYHKKSISQFRRDIQAL